MDHERPPRRLRKRAAEQLGYSLQRVDECWRAGRLRVLVAGELSQGARAHSDGESLALPLEALVYDVDRLLFDDTLVGPEPARAYALLNKPKHVTSTVSDPTGQETLAPYLSRMPAGCFPVGRLDRDSTGLLLFTNDGDLATAILRPDHTTSKDYWLWIDDELAADDARLAELVSGIEHHGQRLTAQRAQLLSVSDAGSELVLTLTQGRKHQIRILCRALDLRLIHLHRTRIGTLADRDLGLGEWRLLNETEVEALWTAAGGRARVRARQVAALQRHATRARAQGTPDERLESWLEADSAR